MKFIRKNGATSNTFRIKLRSSLTGNGLTGLTISSAGLSIGATCDNESTAVSYTQSGSTIQTIATLGTFAAPSANNCRFKEVDSTKHPGLYELQFLDSRFSVSNAKQLNVDITAAANLIDGSFVVQLSSADVDDGVRMGLTAVPNASAGANGGMATVDANNNIHGLQVGTGTGQLNSSGGKVPATIASGDYSGNTPQGGDAYAYLTTNLGAFGAALSAIPKTGFKLASDGLASVTAWTAAITGNITGNLSGSVGSVTAVVAANLTQILGSAVTGTGSLISAAFTKLFNIATPASSLNDLATGTQVAAVTSTVLGTIEGSTNWQNLDATISSRLASSGYTAPPSADSIQQDVWNNLPLKATYDSGTRQYTVWSLDGSGNQLASHSDITSLSIPSAAAIATAVAAAILATPAYKITTNPDGSVNAEVDTNAIAAAVVAELTESGVTVNSDSIAAIATALSSALASTKNITLQVPPVVGTTASIVAGDDYLIVDGRQLVFTLSGVYPDWTSGTVQMHIASGGPINGTIPTPSGSTRAIWFEIPRALSATLETDDMRIVVTGSNGSVMTEIAGSLQVAGPLS